jgi:Tfp pilus assembly protein PilN
MAGLGGSFLSIKVRQRAVDAQEKVVNAKMSQAKGRIAQFEEFQRKRKEIMKTALTTMELLEPVPRSVLLASLTNELPGGVSLVNLKLIQKEAKNVQQSPKASNKYAQEQAKKNAATEVKPSREQLMETYISIEGIAPTDLQVASYIKNLSNSPLLDKVAMVESKEFKNKELTTFRLFKLTAMLKRNVQVTKNDINKIRGKS